MSVSGFSFVILLPKALYMGGMWCFDLISIYLNSKTAVFHTFVTLLVAALVYWMKITT